MLLTLILSLLISPVFSYHATNSQVLGWQSNVQTAGDIVINEPQKINPNNLGVEITADTAIVIDKDSQKILFSKNPEKIRPVASITKLMTALVFLDANPDLNTPTTLTVEDVAGGSKLNVSLGEKILLKDVLALALINSDNNATLSLAHFLNLTADEFVKKMNLKAKELGLKNTTFADPVGLSKNNLSTAVDVTKLLSQALSNTTIVNLLNLKNYTFKSLDNKTHSIKNTNDLLKSYLHSLGGKTGYTEEAKYCFTGLFELKNKAQIITVILGANSDNSRFQDTKILVDWVENNYQWP